MTHTSICNYYSATNASLAKYRTRETETRSFQFGHTAVPPFSGPSDRRTPPMGGHFSRARTTFQSKPISDERTPPQRGQRHSLNENVPLLSGHRISEIFSNVRSIFLAFLQAN